MKKPFLSKFDFVFCLLVVLVGTGAVFYPGGTGGGGGTGNPNAITNNDTRQNTLSNSLVVVGAQTNLGGIFSIGAAAQPGTITAYNAATNATFFFNGTSLYTGYGQLTNGNNIPISTAFIPGSPVVGTQITNTSFAAIGVVTNDANGKLYTTPTLPSTLLGSGLALYGGNTYTNEVVSQTFFQAPNASGEAATADTTGITRCVIPANGTLANLYVIASANPGAVANTVTIMTNGVSTGITVTLNNVTSASDTTHTAPVLAGYEVGIKLVTAAGTAVKWGWGFQLK